MPAYRAGKTALMTAPRCTVLIASTETLRAHNEGSKVFYRQVGITKVRWLIADDSRTYPCCLLFSHFSKHFLIVNDNSGTRG